MARRVALFGCLAGAVLALGSGAHAQTEQRTEIYVTVLGLGTVTSNPPRISCGEGKRDCYAVFTGSGSVTLTVDPADGWAFKGWRADSVNCDGSGSCTVPLDGTSENEEIAEFERLGGPTATLTVDPEPQNGDIEGGDIDCGSTGDDCTWTVPQGSVLTFVPDEDVGFVFTGWSKACTGIARSCSVNLTASTTLSATFDEAADRQRLEVDVDGSGRVTGGGLDCTASPGTTCVAYVLTGTSVTLTATPASGATFAGWSQDVPTTCTTGPSCTVNMNAPKTVKATFTTTTPPPGGGSGDTFLLTVSVTGSGRVTGAGISCGNGGTVCSSPRPAGSTATLAAEPAAGATFRGWGGACSSAGDTCTVTMSAARNVTATFSTPVSGGTRTGLTLRVTGAGVVSASGGTCTGTVGATRTCTQTYETGARVTLTAAATRGHRFAGWGGACSGTVTTCSVTMSEARTVTAAFATAGMRTPTRRRALEAQSAPHVARTPAGFAVTLRLTSSRRGTVRMRALRAGRVQTSLTFTVAPGPVRIGPFPLAHAGYYVFEARLAGGDTVRQTACLGTCGATANAPALVLARTVPTIDRAGAAWALTVRFRTSVAIGAHVRLFRGKRLVREQRFAADAGARSAGPYVLSPGTYTIRLTALDAWGRRKSLTWTAVLP